MYGEGVGERLGLLTLADRGDLGAALFGDGKRVEVVAPCVVWLSEHVRETEHDPARGDGVRAAGGLKNPPVPFLKS